MASAPHRNINEIPRLRAPWPVAAGLGAALALMTGCGNSGGSTPPPPSATPSATPSASVDPQAARKGDVLKVYQRMWAAQVKAYSSGTLEGAGLRDVATDKALSKIKVTALYYQDRGTVMKGEPKLSPEVTALSGGKSDGIATISDCIDSSGFVQVDKKSRKPVGLLDDNRRHTATGTARTVAGRWLITDFDIDRDRTC